MPYVSILTSFAWLIRNRFFADHIDDIIIVNYTGLDPAQDVDISHLSFDTIHFVNASQVDLSRFSGLHSRQESRVVRISNSTLSVSLCKGTSL